MIAQEVEPLFPQLVNTDETGFKTVSYDKLGVVAVAATQEAKKKIAAQALELERVSEELAALKKMVLELQKGGN